MSLSNYKLHILENHEKYISPGSLVVDIRFFDYDSLTNMYGKKVVDDFIKKNNVKIKQ